MKTTTLNPHTQGSIASEVVHQAFNFSPWVGLNPGRIFTLRTEPKHIQPAMDAILNIKYDKTISVHKIKQSQNQFDLNAIQQ